MTLYRRIGSAWGRVQVRIALALAEGDDTALKAAHLHEAHHLAGQAGLVVEAALIEALRQSAKTANHEHVLLFV